MYYREIKVYRAAAIIALLVIIATVFFAVDYLRVDSGKSPIFCISLDKNGDSIDQELYGAFYKVNKYVYIYEEDTSYEIGPWWMDYDKPELNEKNNQHIL
ncbi:MAG: hypothetical protein IKV94_05290 [Clostridia bacterium]|nr:hypothetical protein [Clostridia bacterium]